MRAQVPLNNVDLSRMSLLYTQGEMAAVTPVYDYDFGVSAALLNIPLKGSEDCSH